MVIRSWFTRMICSGRCQRERSWPVVRVVWLRIELAPSAFEVSTWKESGICSSIEARHSGSNTGSM